MGPLIEFLPFGILAGIPAGVTFFLMARWKGRGRRAWGLSMWALAAVWLAGAAAVPSMTSTEQQKAAAMPVVFLAAGCFLLQAALFVFLLLARKSAAAAEMAPGSAAS